MHKLKAFATDLKSIHDELGGLSLSYRNWDAVTFESESTKVEEYDD